MKQSNSYLSFKERTQEIFNFAVLITLSVPVLKQNLKTYRTGLISRLPDPDYFEPSVVYEIKKETIEELKKSGIEATRIEELKLLENKPLNNKVFKEKVIQAIGEESYNSNRNIIKKQSYNYVENIENCAVGYQSKLATYLYFSTFSYFEAFISDISIEIIDSFDKLDKTEYLKNHEPTQDLINDKIKLDKKFDPRKKDRYLKFSSKLKAQGYYTPEEIMFSSLTDLFNSKITNLKANEIPEFLEKTFLFNLTKDEKETFHSIRNNRNSIGHGDKGFTPNLTDVIKANKFFKRLSDRIDKHVIFYFFKLNNYQP